MVQSNAPETTAHPSTMLRFITCGSVDDGKSTLIGRLLYDSRALHADELATLASDSALSGTCGRDLDFALLVDGLAAEREQGITIDVAYRFFATARRKFIVADCPGHEQYTRNMVTGASTAELAVILVDARKGVLVQTRRHAFLCHLLGIRHFVLAVNKMDLADYQQPVFDRIADEFGRFADSLGIAHVAAIPLSGTRGDNVVRASTNTPWYHGPALLAHLEGIEHASSEEGAPFRMPVQWVNRPNQDFRGFAGLVASGTIRPGDAVRVLPGGRTSTVEAIVTADGALDRATARQSVTLTLDDALDCARGDMIAGVDEPPQTADQFEATIVWLGDEALRPGRGYWLKLAAQTATASMQRPKHRIDVDTLDHLAAKTLALNDIGVAEVFVDKPLVFEPYEVSRTLGGFILVDKESDATVAAGMIHFALRRSQNVHWQPTDVTRADRAAIMKQTPHILWFTGLSGSGKSTIANAVEKRLAAMNCHTFLLDGDNIRHGLNKDLGFTEADRIENIRRVAEVAKLMADAGLIVLTAFISPFRAERQMVRTMMEGRAFVEIYVDTPLEVAEARDPKGLYRKARAGGLANFTGIDSPYEPPEEPDIIVNTQAMTAEQAAEHILRHIGALA